MSALDESRVNSTLLPVAVADIKVEPPEHIQTDIIINPERIKLENTDVKQEIKFESNLEAEGKNIKKIKGKFVNPLADGVIISRKQVITRKNNEKKLKRAMKKALLVMKKEQKGKPFQGSPWDYGCDISGKTKKDKKKSLFHYSKNKNKNKVFFLEMLDLPMDITYDDVWNLLKDCNSAKILKLTIENSSESKKIVKVYFTNKSASVVAMDLLKDETVHGEKLRMRTRTLSEKNSRIVSVAAGGPLTTYTLSGYQNNARRPDIVYHSSDPKQIDITRDSTDSDVELLEPEAKRPKKNAPPWRPDLDMYEKDPTGLYGLKPEFLQSLNIKLPITPWVLVTNFRCSRVELKEVMDLAGEVLICNVTHTPKIGNVMYKHPLEAVQAVSMLNNQMLYGQKLIVQIDANPPMKCFLPIGLNAVGPGLGIYGKPLRDLVRHYKRYVKKQSCLLDKRAFQPVDMILPVEVSDTEEKQDNLSEQPHEIISEDAPDKLDTENRADDNDETMNSPINTQFKQTVVNEDNTETEEPEQNMDTTNCSQSLDNDQNAETDDANEQESQNMAHEQNPETDDANDQESQDMADEYNTETDDANDQESRDMADEYNAENDDANDQESQDMADEHNPETDDVNDQESQTMTDEQNNLEAQSDMEDGQTSERSQSNSVEEIVHSENLEPPGTESEVVEQSSQNGNLINEHENSPISLDSSEIDETSSSSSGETLDDSESNETDDETDSLNRSISQLSKKIDNQFPGRPSSFVGVGGSLNKSNSSPNLSNVTGSRNQSLGPVSSIPTVGQTRGYSQAVFRPSNPEQSQFNIPTLSPNIAQNRPLGLQNVGPAFIPRNIPNMFGSMPLNAGQNGPGFNVMDSRMSGPPGPRMSGPPGPRTSGPPGPIRMPGPIGTMARPIGSMARPTGGPMSSPMGVQMSGPMRMPGSNSSPMMPGPGPTRTTGLNSVSLNRPMNMPGPSTGQMGGPVRISGPNVGPRMPSAATTGPNNTTVKFSNLPLSTTFAFLCEKMAECGQVTSVQFTTPGCALVKFAQYTHAKACWQLYNNARILGNVVSVTFV